MPTLKFRVVSDTSGLAFHLVSETDAILLTGSGFSEREACIAGIQAVLDILSDEDRYAIRPETDGFALTLTTPDNRLLAQSEILPDEGAASALRDSLVETASEQEEYDIALPGTVGVKRSLSALLLDAAAVNPANLYDFTRLSLTGTVGFELFQVAGEERFYFHINDTTGIALLFSREFRTASQRNQRMRMVAKCGVLKQRYERREEDGRHFFILKARNGQEIARSRAWASFAEMDAALVWLLTEMAVFAEAFTKRASGRTRRKDGFNLGLVSLLAVAGFELLRDATDKLYYFVFHSDDGAALLYSRGYATRAGRDQAVQTLIRLGANPARYEAIQTREARAFVIRAGNGHIIAHSREFDTAEEVAAAMVLARTRVTTHAATFGVATTELETAQNEQLTLRVERDIPDALVVESLPVSDIPEPIVIAAPLTDFMPVEAEPIAPLLSALPAIETENAVPITEIENAVPVAAVMDADSAPVTEPQPESAVVTVATETKPASAVIPAPVIPVGAEKSDENKSRRKGGAIGWLAYAIPLVLLLFAAQFLLSRGCKPGSTEVAGTPAPGRGNTATTRPPTPAAPIANGQTPTAATHGEPSHPTVAANTPPQTGNGTPSHADGTTRADVRPAHSGSVRMEAALAAYLSSPHSPEPRVFTMDRLAYPPNSHEVNPAGKEEIKELAHLLVRFPNAKIALHGHIDGREQEPYSGPKPRLNFPLSKLRADCVCRRLHFLGVDYNRMSFVGDGNTHPTADDSTEAGRQQNRRMDITVVAAH